MNKPTIKGYMIRNFSFLANVEELGHGNNVILMTAFGLITGNIMMPNSDESNNATLANLTNKFYEDYTAEFPDESRIPFDGYVTLENVVVHSHNGTTYHLPYLMVFIDQIIGVTVGKI